MTRDDDELDLLFAPYETGRNTLKQRSVKGVHLAFAKRSSAYAMQLFDKKDVQLKLESAKRQKDSEELQACLRKMQSIGGMAFLVPQPERFETILDGLLKRYPHFHNVIDFLRLRMRLNALNAYPVLDFGASILLDGPAGCGKTSFLAELSRSFETKFVSISCARQPQTILTYLASRLDGQMDAPECCMKHW